MTAAIYRPIIYAVLTVAVVGYGWAFEPAVGFVIGGALAHMLTFLFLAILLLGAFLYRWFDAAILSVLCSCLYSLFSLSGKLRMREVLGENTDVFSVFVETFAQTLLAYLFFFSFYYLIRFFFETKGSK